MLKQLYYRLLTALFLAIAGYFIFFHLPVSVTSAVLAAILGFILLVEWPCMGIWWLTPLYPVMPFVLMILLNQSAERCLLILLVLTTCSHDTGAFFVGKLFGRHKIAPRVSPGKTWEGIVGGLVLSAVISWWYLSTYHFISSLLFFTIFILAMNSAAIAGDLFESWLKRRAGVKDSGVLLPGHGGLLDRFDSLLFAGIIVYLVKPYL